MCCRAPPDARLLFLVVFLDAPRFYNPKSFTFTEQHVAAIVDSSCMVLDEFILNFRSNMHVQPCRGRARWLGHVPARSTELLDSAVLLVVAFNMFIISG
jgi:hypothetical protein